MTVAKDPTPPPHAPNAPSRPPGKVVFVEKYPGTCDIETAASLLKCLFPPAERSDNKPIDRHIVCKYENGNTAHWDLTAFQMALLGLKFKLISPPPTAQHHSLVATCMVPADYVVAATDLRNVEFAHRAKVRMPDHRYKLAMDIVDGFVNNVGLEPAVADGLR